MDEEAGFVLALAAAPDDLTAHLVYADWLDEHDDPGGPCLRVWVELMQTPYEDATYQHLLDLTERFRTALLAAEPDWVDMLGQARDWVDAALAEKATRLHLRTRHGRKRDRQWLGRPNRWGFLYGTVVWRVPYWRRDPASLKGNSWSIRGHQITVEVDRITANVQESGLLVGRLPDTSPNPLV